jgi:NADH:ubiquinone oxidoreductase subunit E
MDEVQLLIKKLADKHGRTRESLIPILQDVVEKERYLSEYAMVEIARELDISAAHVFGTATFYTFLDTVPRGKNIIRICKSITCSMHGKIKIIEAIQDALKIKVGETTQNRKFSLLETNCLGWCHKGPAMLINDDIFTELNPEKAREIMQEYFHKG